MTQNSADMLGVDSNALWNKVKPVILQESLVESPEQRALKLVSKLGPYALNKKELALLVLAGLDHLMTCAKGRNHEYPLLRN